MFRAACRLYSTQPPKLPADALVARTQSSPLAVRYRRGKKRGSPLATAESDATPEGLTPSEEARYTRLHALQQLPRHGGSQITRQKYLHQLNSRRSRIRGIRRRRQADGQTDIEVVGVPVYLPNIIFKLIPNYTPPGQPYNPYEATFYVPISVTKTDIRSYLLAMYGLQITYIRTEVQRYTLRRPIRDPRHEEITRFELIYKARKRAVVGLVDPFYYPNRVEDMDAETKEEFDKVVDTDWSRTMLRLIQKAIRGQRSEVWPKEIRGNRKKIIDYVIEKNELPFPPNRVTILKNVMKKRAEREDAVESLARKFRDTRIQEVESPTPDNENSEVPMKAK